MPVVNNAMTETNSRDLFPGALELMILESLRREPAHGYAPLLTRWVVTQLIQHSSHLHQR